MNEAADAGRDLICIILVLSVFVWVFVFMENPDEYDTATTSTNDCNEEVFHD